MGLDLLALGLFGVVTAVVVTWAFRSVPGREPAEQLVRHQRRDE
ncbi:MAG: hypothetical protein ACYCWW_02460 [Deltaproteobacteria bacterium]